MELEEPPAAARTYGRIITLVKKLLFLVLKTHPSHPSAEQRSFSRELGPGGASGLGVEHHAKGLASPAGSLGWVLNPEWLKIVWETHHCCDTLVPDSDGMWSGSSRDENVTFAGPRVPPLS